MEVSLRYRQINVTLGENVTFFNNTLNLISLDNGQIIESLR